MKELKKLALILRALGITANVVSEQITCNDELKILWFMIPYIWIVCCKLLVK